MVARVLPFKLVREDFFIGESYVKESATARVLLHILQNSSMKDKSYSIPKVYYAARREFDIRYPEDGLYLDQALGMSYSITRDYLLHAIHPDMVSATLSELRDLSIILFDIFSRDQNERRLRTQKSDRVRLVGELFPETVKGMNLARLVSRPIKLNKD